MGIHSSPFGGGIDCFDSLKKRSFSAPFPCFDWLCAAARLQTGSLVIQ